MLVSLGHPGTFHGNTGHHSSRSPGSPSAPGSCGSMGSPGAINVMVLRSLLSCYNHN